MLTTIHAIAWEVQNDQQGIELKLIAIWSHGMLIILSS
jgi:hypothetical protein